MVQPVIPAIDLTDSKQTNALLATVVERLVQMLHPDRIYLFGSLANQAETIHDIDLLVVVPETSLARHYLETLAYDALWGLAIPVDVIVLPQDKFLQERRVKTTISHEAVEKGRLLYGRSEG